MIDDKMIMKMIMVIIVILNMTRVKCLIVESA